jgi:hypothetical protein
MSTNSTTDEVIGSHHSLRRSVVGVVAVVALAAAAGLLFASAHAVVSKPGGDSSSLNLTLWAASDSIGVDAGGGLSQPCRFDPPVMNNLPD